MMKHKQERNLQQSTGLWIIASTPPCSPNDYHTYEWAENTLI